MVLSRRRHSSASGLSGRGAGGGAARWTSAAGGAGLAGAQHGALAMVITAVGALGATAAAGLAVTSPSRHFSRRGQVLAPSECLSWLGCGGCRLPGPACCWACLGGSSGCCPGVAARLAGGHG